MISASRLSSSEHFLQSNCLLISVSSTVNFDIWNSKYIDELKAKVTSKGPLNKQT